MYLSSFVIGYNSFIKEIDRGILFTFVCEEFVNIGINSSLNVWMKSVVKSSGPGFYL
jgi:hypothetical protein